MPEKKTDLRDLPLSAFEPLMLGMGEPKFRARQVIEWLYAKNAASIEAMTNLSKTLRERLSQTHTAGGLPTLARRVSRDGAIKYLFGLNDGLSVETVYIPEEKRKTVCVSTQVGCKFACLFCATGAMGFSRNLSPGEILNQIAEVRRDAGEISNVVFMGMGEPLDNFDAVTRAAGILHSEQGLNIGARRITVSTVGIPPAMERLGKSGLNVNLAVSLHAADDEVRARLMPVNKRYPVAAVMAACAAYPLQKGRKITFEVVLFDGVNDRPQDAQKLIKALHGIKAKVNIIRFNAVEGVDLQPSSSQAVERFQAALTKAGIEALIRNSRGEDIKAACGQLKTSAEKG